MSAETRLQKNRREWAEQLASWFPSKSAKHDLRLTKAKNRRIDKKKGFTSARGRHD